MKKKKPKITIRKEKDQQQDLKQTIGSTSILWGGGGYAPFHRIIVSSISMLYVHEFRA
jgi:hypothetical protein